MAAMAAMAFAECSGFWLVKHTFVLCPNFFLTIPGSCFFLPSNIISERRGAADGSNERGFATSRNSAPIGNPLGGYIFQQNNAYLLYDVGLHAAAQNADTHIQCFLAIPQTIRFNESAKHAVFSHWFPTLQLFEAFSDKYFNKTLLFTMFYPCCSSKY